MSANGSLPAPGCNLTYFAWQVTSLPDNRIVASVAGFSGTLTLPTGKYVVGMAAYDSSRGNATASKEFVIGAVSSGTSTLTGSNSAVAVISLPPPQVNPASGSGLTRVVLDSHGSASAAGAAAVSILWAVVLLPQRIAAANATGAKADVWLKAGSYQVGLLISDSYGNTATVRKTFTIGPAVSTSSAPAPSTSTSINTPPIIKPGLSFSVAAGGSFSLAASVSDPDPGDTCTIKWTLMASSTGKATSGTGAAVSVAATASPGAYQLLLTATDSRGGIAEAAVGVAVLPASPSSGSTSSTAAPPSSKLLSPPPLPVVTTAAPSIYGAKLSVTPKLPTKTFTQGTVLEVHAATSGLFNLSSAGWRADLAAASCSYTLSSTGNAAAAAASATVYGCTATAQFRLSTPGAFKLTLKATLKGKAAAASAASTILVITKPYWSDFYAASALQGFPTGRCTDGGSPFAGTEFTALSLGCGGVALPRGWGADQGLDSSVQIPTFSWKLTALTQRAAAAHPQPLTRSSTGSTKALFGAVAAGLYLSEVVGSAAGSNTAVYYLSTLLIVEPTSQLLLPAPQPPSCAGAATTLTTTPVALLSGQAAAPAAWSVAWVDAKAATGKPLVLAGTGSTFGFVLQPGVYNVTVTMEVKEDSSSNTTAVVRRLTGKTTVGGKPCISCTSATVTLNTAATACAPAAGDVLKLLASKPSWLGSAAATLSFAPGSDLKPANISSSRALTVVAQSASSNMTATCRATRVTITDTTPPTARLLKAAGAECASPANSKWACWTAAALVTATDNCAAAAAVVLQPACAAGGGTSGSSPAATCKILADGRVCIKAVMPPSSASSWVQQVDVRVRDGYGNYAAPSPSLTVELTVFRTAKTGCVSPNLSSLP